MASKNLFIGLLCSLEIMLSISESLLSFGHTKISQTYLVLSLTQIGNFIAHIFLVSFYLGMVLEIVMEELPVHVTGITVFLAHFSMQRYKRNICFVCLNFLNFNTVQISMTGSFQLLHCQTVRFSAFSLSVMTKV